MYDDHKDVGHPGPLADPSSTERHSMDRWRFRADQVQMLYQQVQIELIISLLFSVIVSFVFWNSAPHELLIGWAAAVVISVGMRSLFISGNSNSDNFDNVSVWGQHYITAATVSGMCWGSLGIISLIYGDLTQQIFVLVVLAGISLTAFSSMQLSPKTISAFVIPTLFPITTWFFYQGTMLSLAIGSVAIVFTTVILFSSRIMRKFLAKSFRLGLHNTDLIKKLVVTREAAEASKKYAEEMNQKLQEQMQVSELQKSDHANPSNV